MTQLALITVAAVSPAVASGTDVSGRVLDENNTPVPEVRIALQANTENGQVWTAVSDTTGTFLLRVEPGLYRLTAEREGFFAIRNRAVEIGQSDQTLEVVVPRLQQTSESVNV